jgi:hypothetical protein
MKLPGLEARVAAELRLRCDDRLLVIRAQNSQLKFLNESCSALDYFEFKEYMVALATEGARNMGTDTNKEYVFRY